MRPWWIAGIAASLGVAVAALLRAPFLGDQAVSWVSDLSQLAAALGASAGAAVAARRTTGHRSRAWVWTSVGTGCWAAGQAVWSWYELALGREVPFPSLADVGFLLFPVAMAIGLVTWLGSQGDQLAARGRDLLDGAIIASSLLVLSWVTAVGSVVSAGADSWLPLALSLAYPVGDLIVATLVLMALARGDRTERATLVVLALGLGGLALADSAYVYLVGIGAYSSADVVSSGWVVGFVLVAAAGLGVPRPAAASASAGSTLRLDPRPPQSTQLRLVLPYLPLSAAGLVLVVTLLRSATTSTVDLMLGLVLVLLVLVRQFLGLLDNHRLVGALSTARDQLQHQATHDGLTGLPNRTLFATRLNEALQERSRDVSVLFCDLDDFKLVNDRHGHDVGDELLVVVAQRLLQAVRASDTVARLGGDEFAILVQSDRAVDVADRVVELLGRPVEVRGWLLATSASVGIAHHHEVQPLALADTAPRLADGPDAVDDLDDPDVAVTSRRRRTPVLAVAPPRDPAEQESLATLLLRRADIAMYAAKEAGKGRAVLDELPPLAG